MLGFFLSDQRLKFYIVSVNIGSNPSMPHLAEIVNKNTWLRWRVLSVQRKQLNPTGSLDVGHIKLGIVQPFLKLFL